MAHDGQIFSPLIAHSKKTKESMEAPIVTTKNGKVKGSVHQTVPETVPVFNYRDIPFAKIQKFEKPEDFGSWGDEVWDGTADTRPFPQHDEFASSEDTFAKFKGLLPMQEETLLTAMKNMKRATDESLHLGVATTDISASKAVMVWIHGGGWTSGTANDYNPVPLAAMGDVVVVNISYRLATAGFLFGNWALFDQVKALEWVRDNISDFGGDPNNVTIFGESAGGWSMDALLCSEKASGLFHKAIAQSGSLRSVFKFWPIGKNPVYPFLMKKYEVDSIEALKDKMSLMSADELVQVGVDLSKGTA